MLQQFINRSEEVSLLKERYDSGNPEFLVIYGRRRVGKTELLVNSVKDRRSIYFLSEERKDQDNISELQGIMSGFLKDEDFNRMVFSDWVELFRSFSKRNKESCVMILDEFPYLVSENPSVPSKFQKIWDTCLNETKIKLVIVGSSISMMEDLLGSKSPIHGRRTGQLEVKPIPLKEIGKFLPKYGAEDILRAYGCVDGIPLYLNQLGKKSFSEDLAGAFFRRDAMLYEEAEFLLRQEFRDTGNYFAILKALSYGNRRGSEISGYTGIEKSINSKYIQNLEKARVIEREYLVTDRKEKRKNMLLKFKDNYYRFWFRFVYPHRSGIEQGDTAAVQGDLKKNHDTYMGAVFEEAAKELLYANRPFPYNKTGRWWHKEEEIDLVALNDQTKEIGFFECKWSEVKTRDADRIITALKEKAKHADWHKGKRKEYYGIIAKKIADKESLAEQGIIALDLKDLK
jgi:uncharacterized protein